MGVTLVPLGTLTAEMDLTNQAIRDKILQINAASADHAAKDAIAQQAQADSAYSEQIMLGLVNELNELCAAGTPATGLAADEIPAPPIPG